MTKLIFAGPRLADYKMTSISFYILYKTEAQISLISFQKEYDINYIYNPWYNEMNSDLWGHGTSLHTFRSMGILSASAHMVSGANSSVNLLTHFRIDSLTPEVSAYNKPFYQTKRKNKLV